MIFCGIVWRFDCLWYCESRYWNSRAFKWFFIAFFKEISFCQLRQEPGLVSDSSDPNPYPIIHFLIHPYIKLVFRSYYYFNFFIYRDDNGPGWQWVCTRTQIFSDYSKPNPNINVYIKGYITLFTLIIIYLKWVFFFLILTTFKLIINFLGIFFRWVFLLFL